MQYKIIHKIIFFIKNRSCFFVYCILIQFFNRMLSEPCVPNMYRTTDHASSLTIHPNFSIQSGSTLAYVMVSTLCSMYK